MAFGKQAVRLTGRGVALALAVGSAALLGLIWAASSQAGLQDRADQTQRELSAARRHEGVLTETISRYSGQISSLQIRVGSLRDQEAAVQARLVAKQIELQGAVRRLSIEEARLQRMRGHLHRALQSLKQRLVEIYTTGTPDMLSVVLNARGWEDLSTRAEYLGMVQDQNQAVAERVRDLRDQTRAVVDRMREVRDRIRSARDAIANQKQQIASTRAQLEMQQSQLGGARDRRQAALDEVRSHEQILEGDLSSLQGRIEQQLSASSSPLPTASAPPGSGSGAMIWPVNGTLTSTFGSRWGRMHEGIDIAAPTGTPIVAARAGTVSIAGYTGGYGDYTCIDHGGGISTCYGHQSAFATSAGASVSQGQLIGYVGSTGESTGPHLHFEVRVNGVAQDPLGYL